MVKRIGKFSLLLKRLKNTWMEMLPTSAMSQEQADTQHRADVDQLNEDRRGEVLLLWIRLRKRPEIIGTPPR